MNGICTLANDRVFDQLIALLNSIEAIYGQTMPVCIYPFDDQLDQLRQAIANRPQVMIYNDQDSMDQWDQFMAQASPASINKSYRIYGGHRRFCGFDAPFDRFVYMDADTLLMRPLDHVWQRLEQWDCVTYDFQFLHPDKVYNVQSPKLLETFAQERLGQEIFCSGFFASKRGLFDSQKRQWLLDRLSSGEAEVLYPTGDQPVLNYMFMRSQLSICNLAHHLPESQVTGCSVTSTHFTETDHVLYDRGARLTYLHYIGVPPWVMEAVCQGENLEFPYRDVFLHYRYLHEPEQIPQFKTAARHFSVRRSRPLHERILKKLQLIR